MTEKTKLLILEIEGKVPVDEEDFKESFRWQVKGQIRDWSVLPLTQKVRVSIKLIAVGDVNLADSVEIILNCLKKTKIIGNIQLVNTIEIQKERGEVDWTYIIVEEEEYN